MIKLSPLFVILLFCSSADASAQLISFSPLRVSFRKPDARKVWWYNQTTTNIDGDIEVGTAKCDSQFTSKNPGTGWSKTRPVFIKVFDPNDNDNTIFHGARETDYGCDHKDNDANGKVDDGIAMFTYWADTDGDGAGDPNNSKVDCVQPVGFVTNSNDCNDLDPTAKRVQAFFLDNDHDGYGSTLVFLCSSVTPIGYSDSSGDCNDFDASVHKAEVYYLDANHDGYADNLTQYNICSSVAPAGYVISPFIPNVEVAFTTRGPLNLNLHGLSMERGHTDDHNVFRDWFSSKYINLTLGYNAQIFSWPGSSETHSLFHPSADTTNGHAKIGKGINGKYRTWKSEPTNPITKWTNAGDPGFPIRHEDSVLNDYSINDYGISFFPYADSFLEKIHSTMVYQCNATPYSWKETKDALTFLKHRRTIAPIVCAGMEVVGRNYNNPKYFFPTNDAGNVYFKTVLKPLHDSLAKYFPNTLTVADIGDVQKNEDGTWATQVQKSISGDSTYAVRVYNTSDEIGYVDGQTDEQIKTKVVARLDYYRNFFPGNKLYIAQWNFGYQGHDASLDSFLNAFYEKVVIDYAADHPGLILANVYNGLKNINFEKSKPAAGYPGLVKSGQLFFPGAVTATAQTGITNLSAVASKDATGKLTIEYFNRSLLPATINYISLDGFISSVKQTANANAVTIIKQ